MNQPLSPATLPADDNMNPYAYCVDLTGEWFLQKGKMIAYYGQLRFEPLTVTTMSALVARQFSSPLYAGDWVVATGRGKLVLGDRGFDVTSFDLDDGNLTIRASNLLAFEPGLALKQSIVPGFLTLLGTGRFLASSNGPAVFLDPPLRVDPQALLGWADCPSPAHHHDAGWMAGLLGQVGARLGVVSGEERQLDFTGAGTVLLQSSELPVDDTQLLAQLEAQVAVLSVPGLTRLQSAVARRLAEERQS